VLRAEQPENPRMNTSAVAAQRIAPARPGPDCAAAHGTAAPAIADRHAFCITLYNEEAVLVRESLTSLLLALRTARERVPSRAFHSTICIIADGQSSLDRACVELFERCGLVQRRRSLAPAEMEFHSTTRPLDGLLQALGHPLDETQASHVGNVEFIVCIKSGNAGKLHSHYVFFELLCPRLRPELCYQIDAGTTLEPDFMLSLLRRMETEPNIAAIAPRITPPIPAASCGFFEEWQYFDFAVRVAVHWPAEAASGFLSVIPGQACVFRWMALARAPRGDPQRAPWISTPIDLYLRGMQTTKPLEKLMFLAEDRVLGTEVILSPRSEWKLEYDSIAAATTDPCENFRELRRQRRRWINSVLACRLALFARLVSGNRSRTRRYSPLEGAGIFTVQLVLNAREFFAPAVVLSYLAAANPFTAQSSAATTLFALFWAATLLHVSLGFAPNSLVRGQLATRLASIGRIALGWSVAALHVLIFATQFSPAATALVLSWLVITLVAMSLVLPVHALRILPRMLFAPCSYLLAANVLLVNAFADFDNLSWGTKGLTAAQNPKAAASQLRRTRLWLLSIWALLNAALVLCSFQVGGILTRDLNIVLEVSTVLEIIFAAVALIVILQRRRTTSATASSG
jgi:cellulose synthase/poly-beta-1,6-N-acetylglucosamine synthase-like glycosyltransferase